ncbi:patatin-like phospholipase family protein [Jeongeupia naejangsanensis]|uniref:Patatin-like phospholipase family protein n=1 Tax=Jeongeupia naejangsanensis TaxID=613195 RepID=A0ABS2BF20_9NEIS|nr:patatin-like phospholipase family protein [Jeongeupia naejangsanensis]MBM3114198.1 patatin-like phospholipase family protein [Jeongeupia naejangsanensis]
MTASFAVAAAAAADNARPRIGLVLGGGGARGLAHIGVLKALEDARVPIDCIVGTSIGALVAGSYAAGRTPEELIAESEKADWDSLLSGSLPRQNLSFRQKELDRVGDVPIELGLRDNGTIAFPRAAIGTQKVEYFLRELTYGGTVANFDQLATPFRAIATDLENGEMVVLRDGDIVSAMRASMAVPGVFPPVPIEGHTLVDGGLSRNMGIDVARKLCADVVIAVDVASPPLKSAEIDNLFSVADQYTRLMILQNQRPQIASLHSGSDVLITPQLDKLSSSDFAKAKQLIENGEAAALMHLPELQRYALPAPAFREWSLARQAKQLVPKPINEVQVAKLDFVNPDVLKGALDVAPGKPLNNADLNERLTKTYARGDFSQLDYELLDTNSGQMFRLTPVEKSWGPNYLNLGLALSTDFDTDNRYSLTARYRRTWINSLGGEWTSLIRLGDHTQFATEFYQPLQLDGYAFVSPYFSADNQPVDVWLDGTKVAQYKYRRERAGLDIGSGYGKYGEVRVGFAYNNYRGARDIGFLPDENDALENFSQQDWGVRLRLYYDQLDSLAFPTEGTLFNATVYQSVNGSSESGKFDPYTQVTATLVKGFKLGSFGGHVRLHGVMQEGGSDDELNDLQWLGGFMNLSSYGYQEIIGDSMAYGRIALYHPLSFLVPDSKVYIGGALEVGQLFDAVDNSQNDLHTSATAFIGMDTFLGPFYVAGAYGDNKKARFYVMLGNPY